MRLVCLGCRASSCSLPSFALHASLLLDAIMGYQIGPPMHPADVPPDQAAKETRSGSPPPPRRERERERERERREPRDRERGREREVRELSREVREHSREVREHSREVSREAQEQPVYRAVENGTSAEANGHASKRQRVG